MDDTIGSFNVSDDDVDAVIQDDLVAIDLDRDGLTFQCGPSGLSVQANHVGSHDLARHYVVEQDVGQRGDVSQQTFNGTGGQCGEGIIGGGKDSEGTFALQRVDQTSSLNSSHQGGEAAIFYSDVNDVA